MNGCDGLTEVAKVGRRGSDVGFWAGLRIFEPLRGVSHGGVNEIAHISHSMIKSRPDLSIDEHQLSVCAIGARTPERTAAAEASIHSPTRTESREQACEAAS